MRLGSHLTVPMAYSAKVCLVCDKQYIPNSSQQKYCSECGTVIARSQIRDWCAAHPESVQAGRDKWLQKHCEEDRERHAIAYQERRATVIERSRTWRLNNPEGFARAMKKHHAKRRTLGFIPVNTPFPGCDAHHMDKDHVAYIPEKLHYSVPHNIWTGKGMVQINALVGQYLTEDWT